MFEETEIIRNSLKNTSKSIITLEEAWLKESLITDKLDKDYFKPIQLNDKQQSLNIPTIEFQKIVCNKLPSLPSDPLHTSMNPYLVLSFKDSTIQTHSLPGVLSGNQIEWIPSNDSTFTIESFFSVDDILSVELWNQYTIHESLMIAKTNGKIISPSILESLKHANESKNSITLQLFDINNESTQIDGIITLHFHIKNNLCHHIETPTVSNDQKQNTSSQLNRDNMIDSYLKLREVKLYANIPQQKVCIIIIISFFFVSLLYLH